LRTGRGLKKLNNKNWLLLVVALIVAIIIGSATITGRTMAYMTDSDEMINTLSLGEKTSLMMLATNSNAMPALEVDIATSSNAMRKELEEVDIEDLDEDIEVELINDLDIKEDVENKDEDTDKNFRWHG